MIRMRVFTLTWTKSIMDTSTYLIQRAWAARTIFWKPTARRGTSSSGWPDGTATTRSITIRPLTTSPAEVGGTRQCGTERVKPPQQRTARHAGRDHQRGKRAPGPAAHPSHV